MEIITYVLDGTLEHKDNMGNGSVIRVGEVQRMSAGTGVTHSEYNASIKDIVHFLQIWILPHSQGIAPSYEQRRFDREKMLGRLTLVASLNGRDGSLTIHQDVCIYVALMKNRDRIVHVAPAGHKAYLHVAQGSVTLEQYRLKSGDGAKVINEREIHLSTDSDAEVLIFDHTCPIWTAWLDGIGITRFEIRIVVNIDSSTPLILSLSKDER
jgi:redox-sensitive bicupin YhaK (pirin superfamily)